MTTPPPTTLGREEIARIIDPILADQFRQLEELLGAGNWTVPGGILRDTREEWAQLLAKADTILSALSAQHEADRARIGELEAGLRASLQARDAEAKAILANERVQENASAYSDVELMVSAHASVDAIVAAQESDNHLRALLNPEQSR